MPDDPTLAERRAALLHAASAVGRDITSILDPDRLLQRTVDVICSEFGFYYAGVFLADETGEWAVLRAGRGQAGATMVAQGHKLRVDGHSMIGAATGRRRAVIALDVGEEPIHFKNPHLPDTRSEMALPLIVGDDLIGALTVQSEVEAAFSQDDITALRAMADQLAIAIDNARLHAENERLLVRSERRARLLEAAAVVGRSVTSILDLDELLGGTVDVICDAYGFYYAGVFLVDDAEWVVLRAGRGEAGAAMLSQGHRLKVGGHSMIGAATEQRQARIALDVGEEPVHFKNPHLPDTRSEMALPLIAGHELIGALTVQSVKEAAFSDEDIAMLQSMADQLAIAIDNAWLLQRLEAAHAELVRTKTYEALATSTIEAIHWIGNKALPIADGVRRLQEDLFTLQAGDPQLVASMREDLVMIDNSVRLIASVQEQLIGAAREEAPRPAILEDVVRDAVNALRIPGDAIHYEVAPDLPLVLADTTQLQRALGYILRNAVEATLGAEERHVTIAISPASERLSGNGPCVAVSIADTGPGISEEEQERIWAPFYTTKGAEHAGLGLTAALRIVQQLGGRITVTSAPAGGAEFTVLLPVADEPSSTAALNGSRSILLIDDLDPWSTFARAALMDAGNAVIRSGDGLLDPSGFEIVLMDDLLEETDNTQSVLRRLKDAGAIDRTTIVASSLRVERTTELLRFGVRDVVLKPYTVAALVKVVG
jgi:GAF domain-containing protein/anti-sigma regulatory factor (Ser/Thr protein kinase)